MLSRRLTTLASLGGLVLATLVTLPTVHAASSTVECGQLSGYTAPDPLGPTDGSLQIGTLPAWDVLATATIGPVAGATLASLAGSGPSCLALDFDDDGKITALEFAAEGTVNGTVAFDSGSGFYLFDDRLIVPDFVTDAYPGLAALFATSAAAGTPLTVTFSVDAAATGQFSGFDGHAAFCGAGSLASNGTGHVGQAIIPAAVLDAADRAALAGAGNRNTCAAIHAVGTIEPNGGPISIDTDVEIDVAAAPQVTIPPTDAVPAGPTTRTESDATGSADWLIVLGSAVTIGLARRVRPGARRRPIG